MVGGNDVKGVKMAKMLYDGEQWLLYPLLPSDAVRVLTKAQDLLLATHNMVLPAEALAAGDAAVVRAIDYYVAVLAACAAVRQELEHWQNTSCTVELMDERVCDLARDLQRWLEELRVAFRAQVRSVLDSDYAARVVDRGSAEIVSVPTLRKANDGEIGV